MFTASSYITVHAYLNVTFYWLRHFGDKLVEFTKYVRIVTFVTNGHLLKFQKGVAQKLDKHNLFNSLTESCCVVFKSSVKSYHDHRQGISYGHVWGKDETPTERIFINFHARKMLWPVFPSFQLYTRWGLILFPLTYLQNDEKQSIYTKVTLGYTFLDKSQLTVYNLLCVIYLTSFYGHWFHKSFYHSSYFVVPCLKIVLSKTMGILVLMATVFGEWPTLFDTKKSVVSSIECYIILPNLY